MIANLSILRKAFGPFALAALVLAAAGAAARAQAPPASALPAGVTPGQAEAARKAVEARPELKEQLPAEVREKLEGKTAGTGKEEARKAEERKPEEPKPSATPASPPAMPSYDWRASVYVGGLFSKRLQDPEIRTLSHYGHEIFAPRADGAAVLENLPVSPAYVIGPGDEVVVRLWGRMEGTHRLTVDRDGKIFFPKIGALYVAGKTFSDLKTFLRSKISNIAEVSSDVTLGQMKGISVSVVGEVRSPGWYNVSSLHTALQALYLAGGVKDIGSLRRIELRRDGKTAAAIDLYDLLLKGESGADTRLLQGDTVFVPVVGKLVAVAGEVRRPAIYELDGEKTLLDAVRMAGGFSPAAYKQRVQVERLEGHFARIVLDADAEALEREGREFALADGDIVRVLPIVLADVNAVILEGNVARPGKYELKPGMTVGTLLPDGASFLPDTYFDYALLTRSVPPDMHKEVVPVNLREIVLAGKKEADVALKPRDTLTVFSRDAFRDAPKATIAGEVRKPGTFDLRKGARVSDLVRLAGDLTRSASLGPAEILRIDAKRDLKTLYFDLGKAMAGDEAANLLLEDEDQVRIHSVWEAKTRKAVAVAGEVNAPGDYPLTEGMRLSDLLFRAGGFKEGAYAREAEIARRKVADNGALVTTETFVVSPERAMAREAADDVPLKEYDLLIVRQIPDWTEKIQVNVAGQVRFPGLYVMRKGERLSSLVERAGGFTADAYLKAAQFTRSSTQRTQQEAIDRLIADLELEVAQRAQEVPAILDKEEIEGHKQLMEARRNLIAQLRKARAKGRVIIHLAPAERLKGTTADILLEDGDRLEVPPKMNVVNVVGRVYNATGVVYDASQDRLEYYLNKVGGPTESADRDHIFMVKADGSVVSRGNVGGGLFGGGILEAKIEPGDSIVVPEKLIRTALMKDIKDITQILFQIAVAAGVVLAAF